MTWRDNIPYEYGAIVYFNGKNYIAGNVIMPGIVPGDNPMNPWRIFS